MKCKYAISVVASMWLAFAEDCVAQGTFSNLDFEAAQVPDVAFPPSLIYEPASLALPGWTAYVGTNALSSIMHNNQSLGLAGVSLFGPTGWDAWIYHGNYAVDLYSGNDPFGNVGDYVGAAIAQTGRVPEDAESLRYYATAHMQVTFAGQVLPAYLLEEGSPFSYSQWGVDVADFAGQVGELRLSIGPGTAGGSFLDSIQFSDMPIPEPTSLSLFLLGSLTFAKKYLRQS